MTLSRSASATTSTDARTVIRGGTVVDGTGLPPRIADVAVRGRVIESIGTAPAEDGDLVIDADGRCVLPGFIDAHSHADAAVFDDAIQQALLAQGVTSVITGQDGISYAPGDGGYANDYFGALLGEHPSYRSGGVAELLRTYDGTTRVNVGYLVPAGTVRFETMGYADRPARSEELAAMHTQVRAGLDAGALGLSTGLDYLPGKTADTAELALLCRDVASAGALYVTHMRGGYETNAAVGMSEIASIAAATGVAAHVSHYHGPADLLLELADEFESRGLSLTFDAYPYRRGASLLAMFLLPSTILVGSSCDVTRRLAQPDVRSHLVTHWFPSLTDVDTLGPDWATMVTLAHIRDDSYAWACGLTIGEAARRAATDPASFVIDVLVAADLQVSVVVRVRDQRPYDDLARLFTDRRHVAGSDGIYVGAHPHPRAWGTFGKYLRVFTRERGDYAWSDAAVHLASRAARRFGLADRGFVLPGFAADLILVDPETAGDESTYDDPRAVARGIDDVIVGGARVLAGGELTGALPGVGLRRSMPSR